MGFWNLNDQNEKIDAKSGSFETGGGNMEPIPAGTQVKAAIDEIKWDSYEGEEFIKARWTVLDGEYKNRKIFHKIKVGEPDPKKADKAKRMLAAIATNAGGGLLKLKDRPTDGQLQQHLLHKPMAIMLQVWSIEKDDGTEAEGNWVSAVAPLSVASAPASSAVEEDEDDPFA